MLIKDWGWFGGVANICTITALLLAPQLNTISFLNRIGIFVAIFCLTFLIKVIKQAYKYYESFRKPIKLLKYVNGDGAYKGFMVLVFKKTQQVEKDTLLICLL